MHAVTMHTLDAGALLSVRESIHARPQDARRHAAACAKEYAARYDGATVREHVGSRWTIHDARGMTFAQFDA